MGAPRSRSRAELLGDRGGRSPAGVAAWAGSRAAPPLLGSLGEGLGRAARTARVTDVAPDPAPDPPPLRTPVVAAVLAAPVPDVPAAQVPVGADGRPGGEQAVGDHTTVGPRLLERAGAVRPVWHRRRLTDADAGLDRAVPATACCGWRRPAAAIGGTVLAGRIAAATRSGRSGVETVGGRAADPAAAARLRGLPDRLRRRACPSRRARYTSSCCPTPTATSTPDRRPACIVKDGTVRVAAVGPGGAGARRCRARRG